MRREQGRYGEAEESLQESLGIAQENRSLDHPQTGEILLELATLRDRQGRAQEAEELRTRGRAMREKAGCVI